MASVVTSQARRLLLHSASQIVQVVSNGERMVCGDRMNHLAVLEGNSHDGLAVVVDMEGKIEAIGRDSDIRTRYHGAKFDQVIDAKGKCVLPGLVDAHTHPVWVGDRVHEFVMKLAGASYLDIHKAGGGIHFTVDRVREADEQTLYEAFRLYAGRMLAAGTTLVECKTGYGLDWDTEHKMLRVLHRAKADLKDSMSLSITYCAAHAVPKGMTSEEATTDILEQQLPQLQRLRDAGQISVDNIDVFCEKGCFDVTQTRAILQAGQSMGLAANFHGEELTCLHSAEMAGEIQATAVSHLEEVSEEGIRHMSRSGTVGVLLPTTAFILRLQPPPARDMIDAGMSLALGSDFNPNAPCLAMPMVMHLACVLLRMTMAEALVAATINSAASLRLSHSHGSLEVGKCADMILLDAPRWEHVIYQLGGHNDVISHVIVGGKVAHCNSK